MQIVYGATVIEHECVLILILVTDVSKLLQLKTIK